MVIIPNSYQIFIALLLHRPLAFTLNSPSCQQALSTPEQAGRMSSSHHSCISLFSSPDVYTAELKITATKCSWFY